MAPAKKRAAKKSFDVLLPAIKAGNIEPLYVFSGEERFLIEKALTLLKQQVAGEGEELAYEAIRGEETSAKDVVGAAKTVSMFASQRLIVVRGAEALLKGDSSALVEYIKAPNDASVLVLVFTKLDGRTSFATKVRASGALYVADPLNDQRLGSWISTRAKERGLALTHEALAVLAEATGTDLSIVDDALERLSLYVGDRAEVTAQDVEATVASSRVRSVFELTDALGQKNIKGAIRTLDNMLANKESPLVIVATLATHIRRLLGAVELGPSALRNPSRLSEQLGIHSFVARKLSTQAQHFESKELRKAIIQLAQTDRELKSSRRPPDLIMEELLFGLCFPDTPEPRPPLPY